MNSPSSSRDVNVCVPRSPSDRTAGEDNQAGGDASGAFERSKKAFGLFRLNNDDFKPCVRTFEETTETFNVDIIAVHGLGGTALETWTHSNGKNWLRDFAPNEFPGARVYTFGYDSGFVFSRGTGRLNDFARSFLEAVKLERSKPDQQHRLLILVCHSMGGIVAKLAITIAKKEPEIYPGIGNAIVGILFLGTPHHGSGYARYGYIMAKTANSFVIGLQASRLLGKMRTDLLKTLDQHSPELVAIGEDFNQHAAGIKIVSFVEGKKTLGLNERVVDDRSADLGTPLERKIPMPGYDHKGLCRHASTSDAGLKLIFSEIRQCLPNTSSAKAVQVPYFPFQRNLDFVGQRNILQALMDNFRRHPMDREVALYGLGGIGKSQIAMEYAYDLLETYPDNLIFWVFGGSKERFEQDYLEIAKRLQLPGFNAPKVDVFDLVKTALEKRSNWVMIIDNADDPATFWGMSGVTHSGTSTHNDANMSNGLSKYIPCGPNGSILYTTRSKDDALRLTGEGQVIKVEEMDDEDLKFLLKAKLKDEMFSDDDLARLITTLDRLPLAIVQAASFIRHKSWSIAQYLANFEAEGSVSSSGPLLHNFQDRTRDHTVWNPVFRTWMITMKQLEEQEPKAADTLRLMSYYNRQDIPHDLLLGEDFKTIGYREERANRNYQLAMSISTLVSYSFLTVSEGPQGQRYTLHRLVQKFVRYWLEDLGIADKWASNALELLAATFPLEEYEFWEISAELLPHVQAIVEYKLGSSLPANTFGILLTAASTYSRMKGQVQRANSYITLALTTLRANLGDDDPITIDALLEQGRCFQDLKQYETAEEAFRSAIRSYSRVFGMNNVKVYKAMIFLSGVLRIQKRYPEAESEARIAIGGLKDFDDHEAERVRLLGKSSLSKILGDCRQYDDALQIQRQVAKSLEYEYKPDHPRVLNNLHDLAVTLTMVGQLDEAKYTSQKVMDLCEKIYGPDHHRTANVVHNLAVVLMRQGYLGEADPYFRRALQVFQTQDGESCPEALNCIRHLAINLETQGHYVEALEHYQNAYGILLSNFGLTDEGTKLAGQDVARAKDLTDNGPNSSGSQHRTAAENAPRENHESNSTPTYFGPYSAYTAGAGRSNYVQTSNYPQVPAAQMVIDIDPGFTRYGRYPGYAANDYYVAGAGYSGNSDTAGMDRAVDQPDERARKRIRI